MSRARLVPGESADSGILLTTIPIVKISTALSEITRPIARIIAVTIPLDADGSTTLKIVATLLAPSAYAPSLRLIGTAIRLSSVWRTMTGSIIIAIVMPPPRMVYPILSVTTKIRYPNKP